MSDQELKELIANLAIKSDRLDAQQAKTDAQLAKTDAQLAKTDAKLNKVAEILGNIGNNQGDVAEAFFYNSLKANQDLAGIHYDSIEKNVTKSTNGIEDEFDIVMINGSDVAMIEVKYKAHEKDLEKLLGKKYTNFKTLYPIYHSYRHHLGLASFYISDELKEKALEAGVIVIERKGDTIETYVKEVA